MRLKDGYNSRPGLCINSSHYKFCRYFIFYVLRNSFEEDASRKCCSFESCTCYLHTHSHTILSISTFVASFMYSVSFEFWKRYTVMIFWFFKLVSVWLGTKPPKTEIILSFYCSSFLMAGPRKYFKNMLISELRSNGIQTNLLYNNGSLVQEMKFYKK